jgi:hypothetical protein
MERVRLSCFCLSCFFVIGFSRYGAVFGPLANALVEQLRLLLQPTRATSLVGDFRTGKRINMKRVIP